MKDLRLPMNELKFDDLVELGRSVIPTLAPAWTDHNVHDPGIMLIELLAWIAEAQMYSVSRMRQDERRAYARLLGVQAQGPQAAHGLIWPFAGSGLKGAPPMSWSAGREIKSATALRGDRPDSPDFYTSRAVQLTTARLIRVETQFANGSSHDWTRANTQESATFMPFGDAPAAGDRLVLTFALDPAGSPSGETPLSLGFEVVNDEPKIVSSGPATRRLRLSLADAAGERPLELVEDTTGGLLKSGVLLLRAGQIAPTAAGAFTVTLRSVSGGFDRPPRVRRIGANVIPVTELHEVTDDPGPFGMALPNQRYELQTEGLVYSAGGESELDVKLAEDGAFQTWTRTDDLRSSGPGDRHFEIDIAKGILTFGNGLNGRLVPRDSAIQVTYRVSAGSRGNLPTGVRWSVEGLAGEFGVNREVTTGGQDAQDLKALRAVARVRSHTIHPLVTAGDLEQAALSFVDLGVKRAVEIAPSDGCPRPRGGRVLVVVGPHDDDGIDATASGSEAAEFLDAIRSRVAPKIPLGQRIEVVGPVYVPLRITATLVAARNTDPKVVQANALGELKKRLAIVTENGLNQWPFGRDVTQTALKGWLRKVEGVARVVKAGLLGGDSAEPARLISIRPMELPLLRIEAQDITVDRPAEGRAP